MSRCGWTGPTARPPLTSPYRACRATLTTSSAGRSRRPPSEGRAVPNSLMRTIFSSRERERVKKKNGAFAAPTCLASKSKLCLAQASALLSARQRRWSVAIERFPNPLPAGLPIKTLNPERFYFGWCWGGLKLPPRRAAPRPSGSRRAASEAKP